MFESTCEATGSLAAIEKRSGDYCVWIRNYAEDLTRQSRTVRREIARGKLHAVDNPKTARGFWRPSCLAIWPAAGLERHRPS